MNLLNGRGYNGYLKCEMYPLLRTQGLEAPLPTCEEVAKLVVQ
jgi:hypothetical protein